MKKVILLIISLLAISQYSFAQEQEVPIKFEKILVGSGGNQNPRTPENIPVIYLNGNTLLLSTSCDGYTLQIVDKAENICYELVIPMGTNELVLPNNLSGEYELRIIQGNTLYYGTINID